MHIQICGDTKSFGMPNGSTLVNIPPMYGRLLDKEPDLLEANKIWMNIQICGDTKARLIKESMSLSESKSLLENIRM